MKKQGITVQTKPLLFSGCEEKYDIKRISGF